VLTFHQTDSPARDAVRRQRRCSVTANAPTHVDTRWAAVVKLQQMQHQLDLQGRRRGVPKKQVEAIACAHGLGSYRTLQRLATKAAQHQFVAKRPSIGRQVSAIRLVVNTWLGDHAARLKYPFSVRELRDEMETELCQHLPLGLPSAAVSRLIVFF